MSQNVFRLCSKKMYLRSQTCIKSFLLMQKSRSFGEDNELKPLKVRTNAFVRRIENFRVSEEPQFFDVTLSTRIPACHGGGGMSCTNATISKMVRLKITQSREGFQNFRQRRRLRLSSNVSKFCFKNTRRNAFRRLDVALCVQAKEIQTICSQNIEFSRLLIYKKMVTCAKFIKCTLYLWSRWFL